MPRVSTLIALFSPEHGVHGAGQAGAGEAATVATDSGLPVIDTYLRSGAGLDRLLERSAVEVLLFDLADVGSRFYTYLWTMHDLLLSAARLGVGFVVLDRPNPRGGTVTEGPLVEPSDASFVGRRPVPIRHGLTAGEMARHLNAATAVPATAGRAADLRVVAMTGWSRRMFADRTGLPWVLPRQTSPRSTHPHLPQVRRRAASRRATSRDRPARVPPRCVLLSPCWPPSGRSTPTGSAGCRRLTAAPTRPATWAGRETLLYGDE